MSSPLPQSTTAEDPCPHPLNDAQCDTDGDGIADEDDACPDEPGPPENNGCPTGGEEGCVEDGLEVLKGTELEGVASAKVHDPVEGIAEDLLGLGEEVHMANCELVVPLEDGVDDLLAELGIPPS